MRGTAGVLVLLSLVFELSNGQECSIPDNLKAEIQSYQPLVDIIQAAVINGPFSGVLYNDLADYLDTVGFRHAGSGTLEPAIDNLIERQEKAGLIVSTQAVNVTNWSRGESSAQVVSPVKANLTILTLGDTIATPPEGITAEVVVVKDFDELEARKDEVPGKIVLLNAVYISYAQSAAYRSAGPNRASLLGAVAVLVRSITPFSINSPHTGNTRFDSEDLVIPAAAITLENANFIARLVNKGETVVVNFKSTAKKNSLTQSRNVIGDIVGATKPQEYVVISGHIDSWDVGQGAMDDAAGAFLAWHSLALISALGLPPPARTLRSIMWTAEETDTQGSVTYRSEREDEGRNWTMAFESDLGVFNSSGMGFSGTDEAACIMQEVLSLLGGFNMTQLVRESVIGSDIALFQDLGVPLGEPYSETNNYFWTHHSEGDWIDVLKTEDLDQNLGAFAATIYILADLSESLPRPLLEGQN